MKKPSRRVEGKSLAFRFYRVDGTSESRFIEMVNGVVVADAALPEAVRSINQFLLWRGTVRSLEGK